MADPGFEPTESSRIKLFWALATHWEILAKESEDDAEREAFTKASKQLRQRTGMFQKEADAQKISENRAETISVLETFMKMGWLDRYTMVDDKVQFWWTEKGKTGTKSLTEFFTASAFPGDVSICKLEMVCRWIVEA